MRKFGFYFFTIIISILFIIIIGTPIMVAILSTMNINVDAQLLTDNAKYVLDKIIPIATTDYFAIGSIGVVEKWKEKGNVNSDVCSSENIKKESENG